MMLSDINERYRYSLIPKNVRTFVIEAGSSFGWYRFATDERFVITLDNFGISGTKGEVETYLKFTFEDIKERIKNLF
jgi:transketolase